MQYRLSDGVRLTRPDSVLLGTSGVRVLCTLAEGLRRAIPLFRVNDGLGGELAGFSAVEFSLLAGTVESQTGIPQDAEGGLPSSGSSLWPGMSAPGQGSEDTPHGSRFAAISGVAWEALDFDRMFARAGGLRDGMENR